MSEAYSNAGPLNTGNAAPVSSGLAGGRRRSGKKLRMVKKKTVRKMLSKMGLKMRGGAEPMASGPAAPPVGGRRRRHRRGGQDPDPTVTAGRRRRRSRKFLGMF